MFWLLVFSCVMSGVLLLVMLYGAGKQIARWRSRSLARHWQRSEPEVVSREVMRRIDRLNRADEEELKAVIGEQMRETVHSNSLLYAILPPQPITEEELDRQIDTDKPVKIMDKEPVVPPPSSKIKNRYHRGPRYRVMLDRIITPRFVKDVDELRTYDDIKPIFGLPAKGLAEELDSKFIHVTNELLQGPGKEVAETGLVQWWTMAGGITRNTVAAAMCALPDPVAVVLINSHFARRLTFARWLSEDELAPPLSIPTLEGTRWIVTSKRHLVPDGTMFLFTYPNRLGRAFVLEDVKLAIERRAYDVSFFGYMVMGATIANVSGVARIDFEGEDNIGKLPKPKAKKKKSRRKN